jgi:hypothetical protein
VSADEDRREEAQWRRIKIAFIAGGIFIAGGGLYLAVFRGVTAVTVINLPGIFYVLGGAFLVHLMAAIIAAAKAAGRSFRAKRQANEPWRFRALPDVAEPVASILLYANVVVQLATLVALALIAAATLVVLPFDRSLAFTLFQALLLALITSAFGSFILTAAGRIELSARRLVSRRKASPPPRFARSPSPGNPGEES